MKRFVLDAVVGATLRHRWGDRRVGADPSEVVLISLVRNGAFYLKDFLEHHLALGVKHVFLLDNGSTDETAEIAREFDRVSVYACPLPFRRFESAMRRRLIRKVRPDGWCLCADVDELFDYPCSDRAGLTDLTAYLDRRGYTAVVSQMLDMYGDAEQTSAQKTERDSVRDAYPLYELESIENDEYGRVAPWFSDSNELSSPRIRFLRGGVRKRLFGSRNWLTKHALFRMGGRLVPVVHPHFVANARIADVTCALYHYKFVDGFSDHVFDVLTNKSYPPHMIHEYARYASALREGRAVESEGPVSRRFCGVDELVEQGFLVASDEYRSELCGGGPER